MRKPCRSNDIEGLAVEADTLEALEPKVVAAITDLFELNGFTSSLPEIPVISWPNSSFASLIQLTERMAGYLRELKELLLKGGCEYVRPGKGDPEIWYSPISNRHFTVD
ncbi:hypothetical protein AMC83_CH00997 [Rhizobium phaseoli]|nr:hypothetical protein AMC83_CH00997 [Rhizobium phaseoli]ANM03113.1 hypothetical protein AMC78_CH00974 [Rhizobium phaseoli]